MLVILENCMLILILVPKIINVPLVPSNMAWEHAYFYILIIYYTSKNLREISKDQIGHPY